MRPVPIIVAILTLVLIISGVSWLVDTSPVTPGGADASEGPPKAPEISVAGPYPKVEYKEDEHDFGTMRRFASGSHKFIVTNNGEAALKLVAGGTTCQCTIGELGVNEIAPGESSFIELTWTIKQPGPSFQHSAVILTNDPSNPRQTLVVKGFIGMSVGTSPSGNWSMGSLDHKEESTIDGHIYSHIVDSFEIEKVEANVAGLEFEWKSLTEAECLSLSTRLFLEEQGPPDAHGNDAKPNFPKILSAYRIRVTADDQIPISQFKIPVMVHTTIENAYPVPITVTGVRRGPYEFFKLPGTRYVAGALMLSAGTISSSKEHTAGLLVICRNFDGELKIKEVTTDPAWLKVSLEPARSRGSVRTYRLLVKFPKGLPSMQRSLRNPAMITIKTNHPTAETINLKAAFVVEE